MAFAPVLPRRVREHDPDLGPDRAVLLGGWLSPFEGWPVLGPRPPGCPASSGSASRRRSSCSCSCGSAPPSRANRYDQIMRLGWKVFIPITIVWIVVVAVAVVYSTAAGGGCPERDGATTVLKHLKSLFLLELLQGMRVTRPHTCSRASSTVQ